MQIEERLDRIEKELRSLKALIMFREDLTKKRPVSLKGMCKILVSEEELEKSIEEAKRTLFGYVLRN